MLSVLILLSSVAAEPSQVINVNVAEFEPLIKEINGTYKGFEIDLFNEISKELNFIPNYNTVSFKELFTGIEDGSADISFAGISITSERELKYDFSIPTFNSGVTLATLKSEITYFDKIKSVVTRKEFAWLSVIMFIFITFVSHILWYTERGEDAINDKYFPGIFEASWCSLCTVSTVGFGDIAPRKWLGRIMGAFIMITGIGFFGIYISEMSNIKSYMEDAAIDFEQLRGCEVATVENTISVDIIRQNDCIPILAKDEDHLKQMLMDGTVCAIMFDTPWVLNLEKYNKDVKSLDQQFFENYYGFMFSNNSNLKEKVDITILKLKENGRYQQIYNTWF